MGTRGRVEIAYPVGILTEKTQRGAKGRFIDGDRIRFRQGLVEKVGGHVLASLGTTEENYRPDESQNRQASSTYGAGASTINLTEAVTVVDGDEVWLFDDSLVGGIGGRSISDSNALKGRTTFELNGPVTADAGDCLLIEYPEEYAGGTSATGGGTAGSTMFTVATGVTTYLDEGSVVRILTNSGEQVTRLAVSLTSGATMLTIEDPLIDDIQAGTPNVFLYAPESLPQTDTAGYVFRFLNQAVAAVTQVQLTEPLPADADTLDVDLRPFQETAADGDQTGVTALNISPVTDFAISSISPFPDGLVIVPQFDIQQIGYEGKARAVHDWVSLDAQKWLAFGTHVKLYLVNNDTLFDITPIRTNGNLVDPFSTNVLGAFDPSGGGDPSYVRVTHVAHGNQLGNYVRFDGATDVGGLDMNGEFTVEGVIDEDNYVVQNKLDPTTTVTGAGGAVSFEYDIDVGLESNQNVQGWGTGGYGLGPYGIGEEEGGVAGVLRTWSLDNFGEDLLASPRSERLYHWDRSLGPETRAVLVASAPNTIERMLVSPEARHTILLGSGTQSASDPGDADKLLIRFSDQESFTDYIPRVDNVAGDLRVDIGSGLITAIESRGDIIVWTDESVHAMQFIGGDFRFAIRMLGQSTSIISANAAMDANGIVFYMAEDDFMIYDGTLRVLPCEVRSRIFDDLNEAQREKVFGAVNKNFTEAWWFYPSAGSTENDRYVKFNYDDPAWDFGTLGRTAFHNSSTFYGPPYGFGNQRIFVHEVGFDDSDEDGNPVAVVSFVRGYAAELGGGDYALQVRKAIPDFPELEGSAELDFIGKSYPQGGVERVKGPFDILPSTEFINPRMKARQVSPRITSRNLGDFWRMGDWVFKVGTRGKKGGV